MANQLWDGSKRLAETEKPTCLFTYVTCSTKIRCGVVTLRIQDKVQALGGRGRCILLCFAAEEEDWRKLGIFNELVRQWIGLVVLQVLPYSSLLVDCANGGDDRISKHAMRYWTYQFLRYL